MSPKKRSASPSSKNISVGRDVVDSVLITGDHNIVNYFKGEYVSLKEHYVPPDSVFQRVRTEDFVGRDWLTVQVDAFLNDSQRKSGAFLLIGDAGVGKTSFMAHLVKERGYLHLFAEQVPGQAMLQRAIQSLGSQLVTRYQIDPYKDRDTLIQGTVFPDFLERLLRMAASKLTGGEKIIITCDALDEAGTFPDGNVFGLPNVLPDGVYLILSQRPVNVKLPNLEPLTVRLDAQGADNLQDMEKYLRVVAQRASVADQIRAKNYSDAFFIQTLKEKSLGVWMYLHYVIKEIEQGSRAPLELEALPTGLVGYYADFWGDWRMGRKGRGEGEKAWNALYAPLLTTLAAAQEAIPIGTLIQWAEVDADEDEALRLVAEDWRAFIEEKEVGAETRYKPYHLSFADFIAGRADGEKLPPAQKNLVRDLAKRTVKAHQRIVKVFEAECNGQWEKLVEREYPRLHLSAHLNGAGEFETLRILLTEGDEKIQWAEAWEQKEETYAGYLNDLSYVWAYAEREQNYALAIRCMLIENSIHSLAENIPPELLAELAKAGIWSYARCLEVIKQKTDSSDQAKSLELLLTNLPPTLLYDAILIADTIKDESIRARTISSIAPYLNNKLKPQAFIVAQKIRHRDVRARAISALEQTTEEFETQMSPVANGFTHINKTFHVRSQTTNVSSTQSLSESFSAISKIEDEVARAYALIDLVPHLTDELQPQALAEASRIKDEFARARILSNLIPYLTEKFKPHALAMAFEIKEEYARAIAVSNLAPYLTSEHKSRMFYLIHEIKNEAARTRIFLDVVQYMPDDFKNTIFREVLDSAIKIKDELARAKSLSSLSLYLSDKLRNKALIAMQEIEDESARAHALYALTSYYTVEQKNRALETVRKITNDFVRANALSALVLHLNDDLKPQALLIANEIQNEFARANALSDLVPYLTIELRELAFALTHEIRNENARFQVLSNLALYLPERLKSQAVQEVLSGTSEIMDTSILRDEQLSNNSQLKKDFQILVLKGLLYEDNFLIEKVLNTWEKIEFEGLEKELHSFVNFTSRKPRKDGLKVLSILIPTLVHFSGEEIVPELYRAIQDTARWWP